MGGDSDCTLGLSEVLSPVWLPGGYRTGPFGLTERASVNPKEEKRRLRREMESAPSPTPATRQAVVRQVERWIRQHEPRVVVGFLAMGDEIDFTTLVERLPAVRFGLTRTGPNLTLTVHDFHGPRERHPYGFEQPSEAAAGIAAEEIDAVLVPGLAFSRDGRRLGRGAGYYDRFLAGLEADKIGLTTTSRLRDDIPREPHDVGVDWIATEEGVVPAG